MKKKNPKKKDLTNPETRGILDSGGYEMTAGTTIRLEKIYCAECDYSNFALTEYHAVSLLSDHKTETGHTRVSIVEVRVSPDYMFDLLGE